MLLTLTLQDHLLLKFLVGVAITAGILLVGAGSVAAKGPESATITGPSIQNPLEFVEPEHPERLARLLEQTGLWYGTGDLPHPPDGPEGVLGPAYTLTWINGGPPCTDPATS